MSWLKIDSQSLDQIWRTARRVVEDDDAAWDCVQEAFATALTTPNPPENPVAWLCGVARNHGRTWTRSNSRYRKAIARIPRRDQSEAADADDLREAIGGLPIKIRDAITLRYLAGMTIKEVAQAQSVSETAAKSRIHRGLGMLRATLGATALALLLLSEAQATQASEHLRQQIASASAVPSSSLKLWSIAAAILLVASIAAWQLIDARGASGAVGENARRTQSARQGVTHADSQPTGNAASAEVPGADSDQTAGRAALRGTFGPDQGSVTIYAGSDVLLTRTLQAGPFEIPYANSVRTPTRARFSAPGFRTRSYLLDDPAADLGDVSLIQSTSYGGRLLSSAGGAVEGVVVELHDRSRRTLGRSTPSTRDGSFHIDLEFPAPLMAMHPGTNYLANCRVVLRDGSGFFGSVLADPRGLTHAHDVSVPERAPNPRIRIVAQGEPVEGVAIELYRYPSIRDVSLGHSIGRAVTDGAGEADLPWPPDSRTIVLQLETGDDASPVLVTATRKSLQTPVHVLTLDKLLSISTQVQWHGDSSPVRHATVLMSGMLTGANEVRETSFALGRSDDRGAVVARVLPFLGSTGPSFELQNWGARYQRDGVPRIEVRETHGQKLLGPKLPPLKLGQSNEAPRLGAWLRLRDQTGVPVVPLQLTLALYQNDRMVGLHAFRVTNTVEDRNWLVAPYGGGFGGGFGFLSTTADRCVACVEASGRNWQSIELDWETVRSTWSSHRVLEMKLPPRGPASRLQLELPDGSVGAHVLVRVLPTTTLPHERGNVIRVAADARGSVVIPDLDRQRTYTAFAIDPASHAMALMARLIPDDSVHVMKLRPARNLLVCATFEDSTAVARPRAVAFRGWARIEPRGLFHDIIAKWMPDGTLQFPALVPELFKFELQAFDRERGESHRMSSFSHRKVLRGADLQANDPVQLELLKLN